MIFKIPGGCENCQSDLEVRVEGIGTAMRTRVSCVSKRTTSCADNREVEGTSEEAGELVKEAQTHDTNTLGIVPARLPTGIRPWVTEQGKGMAQEEFLDKRGAALPGVVVVGAEYRLYPPVPFGPVLECLPEGIRVVSKTPHRALLEAGPKGRVYVYEETAPNRRWPRAWPDAGATLSVPGEAVFGMYAMFYDPLPVLRAIAEEWPAEGRGGLRPAMIFDGNGNDLSQPDYWGPGARRYTPRPPVDWAGAHAVRPGIIESTHDLLPKVGPFRKKILAARGLLKAPRGETKRLK